MLRDWARIAVGVGLAMTLVGVSDALDGWIGIPNAHHYLTVLFLTAWFVQAYRSALRARRQVIQRQLALFRQISHQLRTSATSIVAYADILGNRPPQDAATRERFLSILSNEATRLTNLVDDALALLRLEPTLPRREWRPVNLYRLAREAIDELAPIAATQTITLSGWLDTATPPVTGEEESLRRLLTNLIDNAVKYNRPHGRVRVGLRRDGDAVLLTVSDTGPGIEREQQTRIFQEFYRGHPPNGLRRRGSGLGLAIVRQTAALHGGSVEVQSEPGQGSIFTVRLPVEPAHDRRPGPQAAARWRWLAMAWAGPGWSANDVPEVEVTGG